MKVCTATVCLLGACTAFADGPARPAMRFANLLCDAIGPRPKRNLLHAVACGPVVMAEEHGRMIPYWRVANEGPAPHRVWLDDTRLP